MPVAVHSSTPATQQAAAGVTVLTSVSFTPPAGALVVVMSNWNTATTTRTDTPSTVSGGGTTTSWAKPTPTRALTGGNATIAYATVNTSGPMQVRSTFSGGVTDGVQGVWVLTGHDPSTPVSSAAGPVVTATTTINHTSPRAGGKLLVSYSDYNVAAPSPTNTAMTGISSVNNANYIGYAWGQTGITTAGPNTSTFTGMSAGAALVWAEVAAAPSTLVTVTSTRSTTWAVKVPQGTVLWTGSVWEDTEPGTEAAWKGSSWGNLPAPHVWSGSAWVRENYDPAPTGALTDRLNQTWVWNGITSTYHIFAEGLDWNQDVGLLMYTDGSGAFGLDNPNSTYLLDADGNAGMVKMAKDNNLLLVTPIAPLPADADGDNCWYNTTGTPNAWAKSQWADALMTYVKGLYPIAANRQVIGGYSSGAQWTTRYFLPNHGESQGIKLAVAIAFGGSPDPTTWSPSSAYRASTVVSFDTGQADTTGAYDTAAYGARGGYNWYTAAGFTTDFVWPDGVTHARDGEFASIMQREITQWLDPVVNGPLYGHGYVNGGY